ncbi:unnamed protein product [Allacma fusca]|uniref:Uncharacterized protein n=1 Tax=Allacma fusca TaxID=39272 RepID=A0A8J2Q591_9HEXA|nr:unnamed protein product [Allacma fusca]
MKAFPRLNLIERGRERERSCRGISEMTERLQEISELFGTLFQTQEELEKPEVGVVTGEIPAWLRGTFIRVGPGKFDFQDNFTVNHWFDGYAILYKFDISEKNVQFHKKFLQSGVYQRALAAGKPVVTEFGTRAFPEPKKGWFSKLMSNIMPIEVTDNGFGAVYQIGSEVFAASDNSFFQGVDPGTLASLKKHDCNKLFGVNMICPHPLKDDNGDIINVGFSIGMGSKFNIIRIPGQTSKKESSEELLKKSKVVCSFPTRWPTAMPFIHSFGLTKNYIVIIEQPMATPIPSLATCVMKGQCYKDLSEWRQDSQNRFLIIDKVTGKFASKLEFQSKEAFFFWHMINCYEDENNQVVIDVNAYPDASVLDTMMIQNLRQCILTESTPSQPIRFVVPLPTGNDLPPENENLVTLKSEATAVRKGNLVTLTPEILSTEKGMELPAINRSFQSKKYDMFYGSSCFNESVYTNAIGKITPKKKETIFWKSSNFEFPGEPTFIPNPTSEAGEEDNGVLLSAVTDIRKDKDDYLLVLDAKDLKEIARASFKARVPQGLHGCFVPNGSP